MIKIEKDIDAIPRSLRLPTITNFPLRIPSPPITTHARRMEIVNKGSYIDLPKYNERYKIEDIKEALNTIYHSKCAYCEQRIEQSHIEHYRPKKIYYWLVYSWDNLILACATCNQFKGVKFEINGTLASFISNNLNIENIHTSSNSYNLTEFPEMINPEISDPLGKIRFLQNGNIESDYEDFDYTIKTCKIDRSDLNDQRRRLLDIFREDITSILVENNNLNDQKVAIETIVSKFIRNSKNPQLQFLAFRKFALSKHWLNIIIKEIN